MRQTRDTLRILAALLVATVHALAAEAPRYNVLLIMGDDLRPALGCYGDAQAKTPHLDRLAARGVRFDRAYVQYPVCNPSRASMLTGTRPEHNGITGNGTFFREKMPDIVTLPQLFRQHGATAVSYGKIYHAGLVEGDTENRFLDNGKSWDDAKMFRSTKLGNTGPRRNLTGGKLKWAEVADLEGGDDDQSDGQTAQQTIAAMERIAGKPWFIGAGFHRPHDPFVVAKKYVAQFPAGSLTLHRDPADTWVKESNRWMEANKDRPFFLYFASQDIHVPRITHERFQGKSSLGPRGDSIVQLDWCVGELMRTLDRLGLTEKTLVVFCSDNGPVLDDGYKDGAVEKLGDHQPAGPFRGGKYSVWEGGTRTPFITRWKGRIAPAVSDEIVSTVDFAASFAALTGQTPATNGCLDSLNVLDALLGKSGAKGRDHILQQDNGGQNFGLRGGEWKLVRLKQRGKPQARVSRDERPLPAALHTLYQLNDDPGERTDVSAVHPEVVQHLTTRLDKLVSDGRSRPLP